MTNAAEDRLHRDHRVIRQLAGDSASPWPGTLLCLPSGETAVAVDADALGTHWHGWAADPGGHVLAPTDILRRSDGHDVLLPVCIERLTDFLDRRGGLDLSAGEGVTLAVSLLRGAAELSSAADAAGAWWLTEAGRPVFATDTRGAGHREATADLLRRIAREVPVLEEALIDAAAALDEGRRGRALERAEAALFAVAEPTALATTTFGPRRARHRPVGASDEVTEESPSPRAAWPFDLSRHLDAEWADVVSRATTGVWRALRSPREGRRRPWLLAGGLACAILVGGLVWPSGPPGTATAETSAAAPSVTAVPSATPGASAAIEDSGGGEGTEAAPGAAGADDVPAVENQASGDLVSVASALLTARTACAGEPTCLADVVEIPGSGFPPGVADLAQPERTVSLLDEFGGAAVLRIDPVGGGAPQLMVVVQIDGRWLLRDVYDVAVQ